MGDVHLPLRLSSSSIQEPTKSSAAFTTVEDDSFSSSSSSINSASNHRSNLLRVLTDAKSPLEGKDDGSARGTPKKTLRGQIASAILDALRKKRSMVMKRKGFYSSSNTTTPSSNDGSGSGSGSGVFASHCLDEIDGRRESADSDDLFELCMAFDSIKCRDGGGEEGGEDGRGDGHRGSSEKNKGTPLEGEGDVDDMPGSESLLRIFGDILNIDNGGCEDTKSDEEIGIDVKAGREEEYGVEDEETAQVLPIFDTEDSVLPPDAPPSASTTARTAGGNHNGRVNNSRELQLLHSTLQLRLLRLGTAYLKAKKVCAALPVCRKAKAINKVLKKVVLWLDEKGNGKGKGKDKEEELWKKKILMGQRCRPSEAMGSLWEETVADGGSGDHVGCP